MRPDELVRRCGGSRSEHMQSPDNLQTMKHKVVNVGLGQFAPRQRRRLRNTPTPEQKEALIKLFKRYSALSEQETDQAIQEEIAKITSTLKGLRCPYPRFRSHPPVPPEIAVLRMDEAVTPRERERPEQHPMDSAQRKRFITQLESTEMEGRSVELPFGFGTEEHRFSR